VRVIAGTARGRRLVTASGRNTRPTADRVREALFSSLGDDVVGATVLDLFAGSGALGIEALSRGAAEAVLVERAPRAVAAILTNLRSTDLRSRAVVERLDAARFCAAPGRAFDIVFCDPPYDLPGETLGAILAELSANAGLANGATVVIERDRRQPVAAGALPGFLAPGRVRTYGDTVLQYFTNGETR
jgi:16S rRNA (guanine966-N2)-methyltransferase